MHARRRTMPAFAGMTNLFAKEFLDEFARQDTTREYRVLG